MPSVNPTPWGEVNKSYHLENKAIPERARARRRAVLSGESKAVSAR